MIKLNLSKMPIAEAIAEARKAMDKEADKSFKQLRAEMTRDGVGRQEQIEIIEMERAAFARRREDYLADLKTDLISGRRHDFHSDAASAALH
jgi:hypothetical protein